MTLEFQDLFWILSLILTSREFVSSGETNHFIISEFGGEILSGINKTLC